MAKDSISRSRLFTPSVIRRIVDNSEKMKNQTLSHLSGSAIGSDRSFKFDAPGTGLKSTQQLNIDWSRFENHTFFNSAEAKVNTAFDEIINNYPFDGNGEEIEAFFDKLTGFERHVFDRFPKRTGDLHFRNSYISVPDRAGALFPSLSDLAANPVLDPREESLSIEMHIFVPPGSEGVNPDDIHGHDFDEIEKYNKNQIICQKLDVFGETGFTLALLDSRLKNRKIQSTTNGLPVWSGLDPDGLAAEGIASLFQRHNSSGEKLWTYTVLDTTLPADQHFKLDGSGDKFADDIEIAAVPGNLFIPFLHNQYSIDDDPAYLPVLEEADYGKDVCDIAFLVSSGSTAYLSASMELTKGKWNHVCASYDRTYGENNIKMYLDSALVSTSERSYNMADLGTMIDEDDLPGGYDAISFHVAPLLIGSGSTHLKGIWNEIDEVAWLKDGTDGAPPRYDADGLPTISITGGEATDIRPLPGGGLITRSAMVPEQTFSGSLDEFRLWHAPRSEDVLRRKSVRNIFSGQDDALRLCYRFNEPSGHFDQNEIVLDSGGESLHAKITNYDPGDAMDIIDREPGLREIPLYPPPDGRFGDPEDPLKNPMKFEKLKLSPILFPSHPDVIALNEELLDEAGWYDTNNPNLITKLIPPHYLLEAQADNGLEHILGEVGAQFSGIPGLSVPGGGDLGQPHLIASLLFTWARYFDEIKMFLDHFVNVLHVDYDIEETVADTFLPFVANYYGFDLPRVFSDAAIPQYMEGENITPDQSLSDLSLQYVQNQIWRRVLTNMNEIIQSKGTHHGIRALLASIGINPDKLFRFREYGGSRTQDLQDIRRHRTEISAVLDFSTTIDNPANNARGHGNLLAGFYPPGGASDDGSGTVERNPWEGVIGDVADGGDNLTDISQVAWYKPLIISPFLSGSRGEVGSVTPDTNIPKAWMQIEIDFSLTPTLTEYYVTKLMLLESSVLNRKVIELEDMDGNIFMFELMTDDDEQLDSESYIRVGLDGILDRVEIAEKIVEVINENSTFEAYNISEENNGKIKVIQPRGGRVGNLPVKMWQHTDTAKSTFTGEYQLVTDEPGKSVDERLWRRQDILTGATTQMTDVDGKLLWKGPIPYAYGPDGLAEGDIIVGVARGTDGSKPPFHGFDFTDSPSSGGGAVSWQEAIDGFDDDGTPVLPLVTAADAHALGIFDFTIGRGASADEKIGVDASYEPVYALPLSALGYNPTPQMQITDIDGNLINVWKNLETGELVSERDLLEEYTVVSNIPGLYQSVFISVNSMAFLLICDAESG